MAKFLRLVNGVPRMAEESASQTIYDETLSVNTTIASGTPISLPSAETYEGDELEVRLNGIRLDVVADYNYVGAGPSRTQITMTFELIDGDELRFRIDRAP
jgi:hypothetical protein